MAETKTRTIITSLELENFKSYAGLQKIGPFHKCFSSVVGPNGSGKSNVIDALLFVFGWRANKIRQGKLAELIHTSAAHPELPFARVNVHFVDIVDTEEGGDDYEEVEGTRLTVSRSVERDHSKQGSTSKYFMDNKKVKFDDVQMELRRRGIDLDHNRFLILQGEVESISMLKPKAPSEHEDGLLEFLEDIIGSNKHVPAIIEAERELDVVSEKRAEELNRVKAAEKDRAAHAGPRKEAVEYIVQENEMMGLKCQLLQVDIRTFTAKHEQAIADDAANTEKASALKESSAEHKRELSELGSDYRKTKAEHDEVVATMEQTRSEYQGYERADIKKRQDLKHAKKALKSVETALRKDKEKLEDARTKHEQAQIDNPRFQKDVEVMTAKIEKSEARLDEIHEACSDEMAEKRADLVDAQAREQPFTTQLSEDKAQLEIVQAKADVIRKQQADAETELEQGRASLAKTEAEKTDLARQEKAAKKELKKAQDDLAKGEADLESLRDQEKMHVQKVNDCREKVERAKHAQRETHGRGHLHNALMAAKNTGKLKGLRGRLGDLCEIDAKYDVAVTTSTPALNSYVVDTTADGERCVKYLRQHNLGVASFIILEKMSKFQRHANAPYEQVDGAPRLYDLITPMRPEFSGALFYAVRNTLVADDLQRANKLAFGDNKRRRRVVTLQGQVIEPTGTMSGGGSRVRKGGMKIRGQGGGSRVTADETDEMVMSPMELKEKEQWLTKSDAQMREFRDQRRAVEGNLRELKKRVEKLEREVKKLSKALESCDKMLADCRSAIPKLEKAVASAAESSDLLAKLEASAEAMQAIVDKTQRSVDEAHKAVQAAEEALENVGGPEARKLRKTIQDLKTALEERRKEAAKTDVQTASLGRTITKLEKTIPENEAKAEELQGRVETLREELSKMEDDAAAVMQAYEEAQELVKSHSEALKKKKKAFEKKDKEMLSHRKAEVDLENEAKELKLRVKEAKAVVGGAVKQIEVLRKKISKNLSMIVVDDDDEEEDVDGDTAMGDAAEGGASEGNAEDEQVDGDASAAKEAPKRRRAPTADAYAAPAGFADMSDEEIDGVDRADVNREIKLLQQALEQLKPNFSAVERWLEKDKEYRKRSVALEKLCRVYEQRRANHDQLKSMRLQEFMDGFTTITMKLKEIYQMITLGGDAELEIVDSLDPFSEGIVFSVRPPKKSWKNISNLSGGEKTLSSLALVFALHHYNPTPLYVMDEIDAALDFKNVSIVAHFLKERTKNAQFVIISLRNHMFELADRLVGIYKTENQTKSVTIQPSKFVVEEEDSNDAAAAVDESAVAVVAAS